MAVGDPCDGGLPVVLVRDIAEEKPEDRWMIQDLWARSGVGLIGGQPKCGKTFLGLDFAVSVASGTKALDRFPVEVRGPVLVYLAEDAIVQVRARVEALCAHRGISLETLPITVITAASLRLDVQVNQELLTATIEKLEPKMLLLDPLVRLHGLDENSSGEISRFLAYFRDLQRRFDLAIILVHHASKKARARPGQALRGSSDLHAFGDSNAYLGRNGDRISLVIEHRAARPPEPLTLELRSLPDGSQTHFAIMDNHAETQQQSLENRVVDHLRAMQRPLTRTALREQLRVNNQKLGSVLEQLERKAIVSHHDDGWVIVD